MRATAILAVIAYHFQVPVASALGVIIFFVLSGFLITGMLIKEIKRSGTISIRTFYSRRAYRIFPAFYVCWFVTMGLALWKRQPVTWSNAAGTFFYFADYGRAFLTLKQQYSYQMGVSWSLAVEEQFYLLWPLALLWIYKRKRPLRAVAWIIFILWLWRALLVIGFHVSWDYAYNAFDTRADALMVGCWLAVMVYREKDVPRSIRFWLSNRWLVLIPVAALAVISSMDVYGRLSSSQQVVEFTLDPVLTAILLLQWIYWGFTDWTLLEHPLVKFIARISYSLYLYHQVVHSLYPEIHRLLPLHHGRNALNALLFLLVACASYFWIERPFMRLRDRGRRASVLMDDGIGRGV